LLEFQHTTRETIVGKKIDTWVKGKPVQGEFIIVGHTKYDLQVHLSQLGIQNEFGTTMQLLGLKNMIFK